MLSNEILSLFDAKSKSSAHAKMMRPRWDRPEAGKGDQAVQWCSTKKSEHLSVFQVKTSKVLMVFRLCEAEKSK